MKRRDFLVEHIMGKAFIEDVMKSIAWTTLCGAVYAISLSSIKTGNIYQGVLVFILFIMLSTLAVIYVAMHIVIPLDAAMYPEDPYWDEKKSEVKGVLKGYEVLKIIFTRWKIFYLMLTMGYFLYANEVTEYILSKA
ncbi:hypothetical protein AB4564_00925 [Vibrio sp. 10N.222.51.E8]|uniref:hypothetical protein n=2 Tax=Vibrio TaxID=662 RepID=UPI001F0E7EF2|nr:MULTISPECIES: hypothetical protein [Vibrio]